MHCTKGSHRVRKVQFFFNIVQKAFGPPPLLFEHHVVNFLKSVFEHAHLYLGRGVQGVKI